MTKDEVLVIKCNMFIHPDNLDKIRQLLIRQLKDGVIILPNYMEPVIVPKDIEIRLEGGE